MFTLSENSDCPPITLELKDISSGTETVYDSSIFKILNNELILETTDYTKIKTYTLKLYGVINEYSLSNYEIFYV